MALRRKFKLCRQPLCSDNKVAEFRAKFGRPGVSGRKRKSHGTAAPDDVQLVKKARFNVKIIKDFSFSVMLSWHATRLTLEHAHIKTAFADILLI